MTSITCYRGTPPPTDRLVTLCLPIEVSETKGLTASDLGSDFAEFRAANGSGDNELWVRRSLFLINGDPLLVDEVFLPAIGELDT